MNVSDSLARTAEVTLENWWKSPGRKPLVIRGARQVGKSTLVRRFAQRHSLVLGTIDLERHRTLDAAFATLDPGVILPEIDGLLGRKLTASDSLLFLDEIQGAPHALPALRYLKEALPELPIVAAGSLLEFVLADHAFSMPVGRIEYFHLGPMSFEEYLLAHQESDLLEALQEARPGTPTPMTVHTRLLHRQREYILVGGMPEAVSIHCETGDFARVAAVHRSIIDTYRDDFGKYASRSNLVRLQRVFDAVPRIVGQKVQYSRVVPDERPREVRQAVELLSRARVIAPVFHSHASLEARGPTDLKMRDRA